MVNQAFVEEWDEETGDHELLAAYDPTTRDASLDKEGVAAEVLFPDADVLGTGAAASSPFGSGLGIGRRCRRRAASWPAPGPTTAGWPTSCATPRASHRVAVVPIRRTSTTAVAEIHRGGRARPEGR